MPDNLAELSVEEGFLLIEADGSHMLPLKMTAEYEPVIPNFVQAVVIVAGMSCIGRPLGETCHRPELAAELLQTDFDHKLTPGNVAAIIRACYIEKAPLLCPQAEFVVLLNQADDEARQNAAKSIAGELPETRCVIASLNRI